MSGPAHGVTTRMARLAQEAALRPGRRAALIAPLPVAASQDPALGRRARRSAASRPAATRRSTTAASVSMRTS